jgi:hypothetical protein
MRIARAHAVRNLHGARTTAPARTTPSEINPRRHAPLGHLGGFRPDSLLARHAPGYPAYDSAHVDVGHPNLAC